MARDRIRFLAESTRLRIAELCRDEARTLGELAAALGRDPGSLSQPRTMARWGALREGRRPLPNGAVARTYRLDQGWRPVLEEALNRAPATVPTDGQDLLLIPLNEVKKAAAILADDTGVIEWAAQVRGGAAGLMLAVRPDPSGKGVIEVLDLLSGAAPSASPLHVVRSMSAAQLRDWAKGLSGGTAALPSP